MRSASGFKRYDLDDPEKCARFNEFVLDQIASQRIGTVFLHGRWGAYSEGNRGPGKYIYLTSQRVPEDDYTVLASLSRETIERLQHLHVRVILIASVPEVWVDVPTVLALAIISKHGSTPEFPYAEYLTREERVLQLFAKLTKQFGVTVIRPQEVLCRDSGCALESKGHALYVDDSHLSVQGAMYVAPALTSFLRRDEGKAGAGRERAELGTSASP